MNLLSFALLIASFTLVCVDHPAADVLIIPPVITSCWSFRPHKEAKRLCECLGDYRENLESLNLILIHFVATIASLRRGHITITIILMSIAATLIFASAYLLQSRAKRGYWSFRELLDSRLLRLSREYKFGPPGMWLREMSVWIFPAKTHERVFATVLDDLTLECTEALNEGRTIKAKYVHVRGIAAFWIAVGFYIVDSSLGRLVRMLFFSRGN